MKSEKSYSSVKKVSYTGSNAKAMVEKASLQLDRSHESDAEFEIRF